MLIEKPFYYIRHGQTDYNLQGRYQGNRDIALNATGIAQANAARLSLHDCKATHIYCSPLKRARVTAEILNQELNLPLTETADLRECNFGVLEGQSANGSALSNAWRSGEDTPEGAETFAEFRKRVFDALNAILADDTVPLIVAHGAVFWPVHEFMKLGQESTLPNAQPVCLTPPSEMRPNWHLSKI